MKGLCAGIITTVVLFAATCKASEPPTQVVYRFDDHRYLELKGWDCEGELWYTDTQRGIHTEPVSQFYRIFTKKYVHPSEKYIAITGWGVGGFRVSKDYGQTWQIAQFSPGENDLNGMNAPQQEDVLSFTVVNDQGFLQTKHRLYMSSKPFDDPRILPGGPGIHYELEDGVKGYITPQFPGPSWGMDYITKEALEHDTAKYHTNYQNLPDKTPEVKNYTGWDHMQCNMDAGK
ncbi:T6SS immunity protein Tli3 family protein [Enterobacter sp. C4G1]|uniref:T6SS immunity protein Tli3 family protein n=1 Tax=Enterobacter sp. C4G1 TaxID=3458724 RepID=UPI004068BE5D